MSWKVFREAAYRALRADMDAQLERWADDVGEFWWSMRIYEPLTRVGK